MFVLPAAIGTYLLVNILCAIVALGLGFSAGVWFFGFKMAKPAAKDLPKTTISDDPKRLAEWALMASSRVSDLAQGVAGDVGDHAAKMKAISADLAGINRDDAGANEAVFVAMDQIVAANAELQQRLEQAETKLAAQAAEIKAHESEARTDSLTGLANRRAFDDELKRRLNEWQRKRMPVTLVLLDIDFFKKLNDAHGHQVGDEVLRTVAKTLRKRARGMDLPCRYGGEEFGVILPATETAGACVIAERIRLAVQRAVTVCGNKNLKVTCSLGLSQVLPNDDAAKLIRRADDALYASKKAGRNCSHWSDGTKFHPICALPDSSPKKEDAMADPPVTPANPGSSRNSFLHVLKRRVTESHRFGIPLTVMHLKIDQYDSVSQTASKALARQMLDVAESALEKALREMDLLARLDQGEFLVMLPGNTQSDAARLAKRMRITMLNRGVPLKDRELHIRFRHGIAQLKPNETAPELVARARQGMAPSAAAR